MTRYNNGLNCATMTRYNNVEGLLHLQDQQAQLLLCPGTPMLNNYCATKTTKHSCYYDQSVIRACHRSSAPLPLSSQAPTAQEKKSLGKFKSISPKVQTIDNVLNLGEIDHMGLARCF